MPTTLSRLSHKPLAHHFVSRVSQTPHFVSHFVGVAGIHILSCSVLFSLLWLTSPTRSITLSHGASIGRDSPHSHSILSRSHYCHHCSASTCTRRSSTRISWMTGARSWRQRSGEWLPTWRSATLRRLRCERCWGSLSLVSFFSLFFLFGSLGSHESIHLRDGVT